MNIEEAVQILNERKHNFHTAHAEAHHTLKWEVHEEDGLLYASLIRYITEYEIHPGSRGERDYQTLNELEAIAIATHYLYGKLIRDDVIKSVQFCLEQDAIEEIKRGFEAMPEWFNTTSKQKYMEQLSQLLARTFQLGKRVGEFPEMERTYRYNKGKESDVSEGTKREPKVGEAIEVTYLGCRKCRNATFEIMSMALEPCPPERPLRGYTAIFVCECFCNGCGEYFNCRVTSDVVEVIRHGDLKGWGISETGVRHFDEGMKQYLEVMKGVK